MSGETALVGDIASYPSNIVPGLGGIAAPSSNVELTTSSVDTANGAADASASLAYDPGELFAPAVVGAGTVDGVFGVRVALSGQADGVGTIDGVFGPIRGVMGRADSVSTVVGVLGALRSLIGRTDGLGNVPSEPLSRLVAQAGTSAGVSSAVGAEQTQLELAGTSTGTGTTAGSMDTSPIFGLTSGVASADSVLAVYRDVIGASDGSGTVLGTLASIVGMHADQIDGTSSAAGDLRRIAPLSGSSAGTSTAMSDGQLVPGGLVGTADGTSDVADAILDVVRSLNGESDGESESHSRQLLTYLGRPLILLGSRGG